MGREAGFIPDRVTLLTDTTNVKGAGAVQDTYTLQRKGLHKLLKATGFYLPASARVSLPRHEIWSNAILFRTARPISIRQTLNSG